jgi:hypothetical protein
MKTPVPNPLDVTQASPEQLIAAIVAQKMEIQRLFKAKTFARMPEAQHVLAQLLRAKANLDHKPYP